MTVGQLARAAGVRSSTVRFYERRRLVLPSTRTSGNYRLYAAAAVDRVRFIQRAQTLGFTLADIEVLLRFSSGQVTRRAQLNHIAAIKLADLDARIDDLKRIRRGLVALVAEPCIDPDAPCPVIGALATPTNRRAARVMTRAAAPASKAERRSGV